MRIFGERFAFLRRPDLIWVGAFITSVQKFLFVLYITWNTWNGSLFDWGNTLLMPKTNTWWPFFLSNNGMDDCYDLTFFCTRQRCIQSLLLKAKTDILKPAVKLPRCSKFWYLLIRRLLQFSTPFVFQLTLLLFPLFAVGLTVAIFNKVMVFFGYESFWGKLKRRIQRITRGRGYMFEVSHAVGLIIGIMVASGIVCGITGSPYQMTSECDSPMCLYCYPRLMYTLFKKRASDDYYYEFGKTTQILLTAATFLTAAGLTCFLYISTILFVCLVTYIFIDQIWSLGTIYITICSYIAGYFVPIRGPSIWNRISMSVRNSNERYQENATG